MNILCPERKSTLKEALSRDGLTKPSDELSNFCVQYLFAGTEVIDNKNK